MESVPGKKDASGKVNLSPMIDMVFILLIFFVVAATFVEETGFEANRPHALTGFPNEKEQRLNVHIDTSNRIYVENRQIALEMIRPKVERMLSADSELAVTVYAAPRANAGLMVEVLDQVRLGGVRLVSLSLDAN